MKFTVITILPELIEPTLRAGVVGRAHHAGTIAVTTINPRDFTTDRHRTVDDTPYGGGPGMVMKPEPLLAAINSAGPGHRVLLSPAGAPLTHQRARALATRDHVILVCGRYEGIDERVIDEAIDEQVSIGDYVLSGGELPALVVIDAVARLVPGVLGEATSADDESHATGMLEYPHYTRPAKLADREVPGVLVGGNHAAIANWRRAQSVRRTAARRPELIRRDRALIRDLARRTHLALVHHPVTDRTGAVVTTSLTNFDIHDIARSSRTYGLASYWIVTPVTAQRDKTEHIASLWLDEPTREPPQSGSRAGALALVRTAPSIDDVIGELADPIVVATSARAESFPAASRRTPLELIGDLIADPRPLLLLFGTGWGLADQLIPSVSRVLTPIHGPDAEADWNHLSVRSAAAVLLDRLFGF